MYYRAMRENVEFLIPFAIECHSKTTVNFHRECSFTKTPVRNYRAEWQGYLLKFYHPNSVRWDDVYIDVVSIISSISIKFITIVCLSMLPGSIK